MVDHRVQATTTVAFNLPTTARVRVVTSVPRLPHVCHHRATRGNVAQVAPITRASLLIATRMADISKPSPGVGGPKGPTFQEPDRGGGVAVITKPSVKEKTKRKSKTEHEPSWRVLLHNDDVHTFDYVTGAIVKVGDTTWNMILIHF